MTGYLCFLPRRILWLPRYSLIFGFPWTCPSVHVHSQGYQWHNCSFNMTRIQALFWLGNTSNRQGLLRCASHFLFRARFLWRSAICKLAMKWYPMCMCTRWLCPFNKLTIFGHCHVQSWSAIGLLCLSTCACSLPYHIVLNWPFSLKFRQPKHFSAAQLTLTWVYWDNLGNLFFYCYL